MPFLFANVVGGVFVETDDHVVFALAGLHAEAVTQTLLERELLGARKRLAGLLDLFDASRDERANVFAQVIVGKEEPFAVNIGQMIGVDDALLGLFVSRLAIGQFELTARGGGFGERVEDFQVQDRLGASAERNGLVNVAEAKRDGVGQ